MPSYLSIPFCPPSKVTRESGFMSRTLWEHIHRSDPDEQAWVVLWHREEVQAEDKASVGRGSLVTQAGPFWSALSRVVVSSRSQPARGPCGSTPGIMIPTVIQSRT
jgi:hypothetical protein